MTGESMIGGKRLIEGRSMTDVARREIEVTQAWFVYVK